ncbi:serine hydrolase domain-containing protein [Kiloniella laminariae]|uniref:serine hydrolase domain-containing protein n=1 Tax=Kiloniella laminariae TaxID=454162 RepID=UPI00038027C5|nr:serine hydrolase [Kiloniella laminariae]
MTEFKKKYGFNRSAVTLENWRQRPYSTWSFQHANEIVPSAVIPRDPDSVLSPEQTTSDFAEQKITIKEQKLSVENFLKQSETDICLVNKARKRILSWQAPHACAHKPHIIFSISKSFTGILAGQLVDAGSLDLEKTVGYYLPEAKSSGFADCSLQHLLDMRVSIRFSEEYLNQDGDYARYRRATAWNPRSADQKEEGLAEFLFSLPKRQAQHGGPFHYLSPASDLLGLLVERVAGVPYSQLMSENLWQPLKAEHNAMITLDHLGAPRGAGGISVHAEDLLRLGEMLRLGGQINNKQIVSQRWLDDMLSAGDAKAWKQGNFADFLPEGRYRNQWYQLDSPDKAFLAVGIHGQWLYVIPEKEIVIVKLSSQNLPQDDTLDAGCLEFFSEINKIL